MKIKSTAILCIAINTILLACKSTTELQTKAKTDKLNNKETRTITAATGGGFTGRYNIYRIQPDSIIYSVDENSDQSRMIGKLSSEEFQKVYNLLDASNYEGIDYNKPGNLTSYIDIKDGATHYKIVWSKSSDFPPEKIVALHQLIFSLAKKYKE